MENHQPPSRFTPLQTTDAWVKLTGVSENLKLQRSLSDRQSGLVTEAVEILTTAQTSSRRKKYKRFLYDVHRGSGPCGVLVCAVALGQVKAADMKNRDRDSLIRQIEISKDHIKHPILQSLAIRHKIPISLDDILEEVQPPLSIVKRPRKRKRRAKLPGRSQVLESPSALIGDAYPDILEDVQHANRGHSENQSPSGYELNDHSPLHAVERPRQRKRALTDTQDSEHTSSTTNSPGPERSVAVQWLQQRPMPTAQPVQLDEPRYSPETRSQHGHALTRGMENPTPKTVNLELPGQGQYYSFSCMRRHMVENLPEPYRTGMKMCNLWCKVKESGGLAITNSLKIYLPVTPNEDSLLVLRLGYYQGFSISDSLGLGDQETLESEETAAEKARD